METGWGATTLRPDLFYWSDDTRALMVVVMKTDGVFRPGQPRPLFDTPVGTDLSQFNIFPDGQRFIANDEPGLNTDHLHRPELVRRIRGQEIMDKGTTCPGYIQVVSAQSDEIPLPLPKDAGSRLSTG